MKKLKFLAVIAVLAVSVSAFAAASTVQSATFYNASGSTTDSVILPSTSKVPAAGNRIVIDNITAKGDVAGAVLQIAKGDAAGVTDNFTIIWDGDVGDATVTFPKATTTGPLFVGETNYQYKVIMAATTTANSAVVNFRLASLQEQL